MRFGTTTDSSGEVHPVDVGLAWDVGAPLPLLLQDEWRAFLVFYLLDARGEGDAVGVIEWLHCDGAVLGGLNDEAMQGHPLWNRGLGPMGMYGASEVIGSEWIAELKFHRDEDFDDYRHFVLCFHDSTFECLAKGFVSYRSTKPMAVVLAEIAGLLSSQTAPDYQVVANQPVPPQRSPWDR